VNADHHLELRAPLEALEEALVRRDIANPRTVAPEVMDQLRYVLSFAKLTEVRNEAGVDAVVAERLAPHRWRVLEALKPHLEPDGDGLHDAARVLEPLLEGTRRERARLLEETELDRESLEAEVTSRQLVVVAGGGGGSGYGFPGGYTLLNRHGLQPELVAGTSMGALMGVFRARTRQFDLAPMVAAAESLSWQNVFRVLDLDSRYGVPATLRLYLRAAIGHLFQNADGSPMTLADLELPMLIVVTGITVDGLKHDLDYYEHFMDDVAGPGRVFRRSRLARVGRIAGIFKEMMGTPEALREIVFGADEASVQADVIDTVGFSSAIPGLIHYDIYREDERMRRLLDTLYGQTGITRLLEGGIVNNLPCRPAYAEVMKGRIGRRNPFVLAMDCFAPRARSPIFLPVQQIVRPNVTRNLPYAHHLFSMKRRLNPLNLVPKVADITKAMSWTIEELEPEMEFISRMCAPIETLRD
jgi:predicted acylesterase/phospholipase RssA